MPSTAVAKKKIFIVLNWMRTYSAQAVPDRTELGTERGRAEDDRDYILLSLLFLAPKAEPFGLDEVRGKGSAVFCANPLRVFDRKQPKA